MHLRTVVLASLALAAPMMSVAASGPSQRDNKVKTQGPIVATSPFVIDFDEQYEIEQESIRKYLAEEHERQVLAYYAEVQRQIDEEAARQAALAAARRSPTPSYHPGTTDGACSGFAIPDYIIQRESGGNPSAYNPSGAYGCAQTLLSHYSSGSCRGLDPYSIEGQRECVYRLSNGGTNLSPWAQTR